MIIDYTKGIFVERKINRSAFGVNYIDDLAYYLYILKYGVKFGFTQFDFMNTYKNRHIFYQKAEHIIRLEKLKKIKSKIHV